MHCELVSAKSQYLEFSKAYLFPKLTSSKFTKEVIESLKIISQVYQQQIDAFQEQLFDLNDDEFNQLKDKLMEIKGIGEKAATGIIIQTGGRPRNGLKNFHSAKALAAFLGLVPTTKQSGTSLKSRGSLVNTACKQLRTILFCAAQSAARFNLDCKELYTRLIAKGKTKKAAKMAVAHKLIRQAFAIIKTILYFKMIFRQIKLLSQNNICPFYCFLIQFITQ